MINLLFALLLVLGGISPATVGEFEQWAAAQQSAVTMVFAPDGQVEVIEGRALADVPPGSVVSRNTVAGECYAPDLSEVLQLSKLKISQWRTLKVRFGRIYVTALSLDRPLAQDDLLLIRATYKHKLKWLGDGSACRAWEATWLSLKQKIGVHYRATLWVAVRS